MITLHEMASKRVERFLTTVLFTDIVGSSDRAVELGDRAWRDLVQQHHALVRAALRRHAGREIDTAGDGFFAVFDAPAAAVECAQEIVRGVEQLGLQVRAGLHVGEVEQIDRKVGGITVPIASRIMATAGAGDVLVSATVRDLAAGAGFRFEDRGTFELKGIPGQWQLFAVVPASDDSALAAEIEVDVERQRSDRRAAAVRRYQSRPFWQRHPRTVLASVAALALVVGGVALWLWSPWLAPALPGLDENSVGVIDPGRNVIIAAAAVGNQPAAIAFGEGYVWIANSADGTVSEVDPRTHAVVDTIDVGKDPTGVTVGGGSVWVANSGERSVTRINAATRRVVDTIVVGNSPSAIAFWGDAAWVANAGDGTVSRIEAATGAVGPATAAASLPSAIAVDDHGVWLASEDAGTVTLLDPDTGAALFSPIAVGAQPRALVIVANQVWVANAADRSLSRIDPETRRVTAVVDVGGTPVGLAASDTSIWIADATGAIERVDIATASLTATKISTRSAPRALAWVNGELWLVARTSLATHRGGTLRIVGLDRVTVDPNNFGNPLQPFVGDGLVGYRRIGGIGGTILLPDLATSLARPADGGLTYSFQLRSGLVYSDGTPIRASDFRYSLERTFQIADPVAGAIGPTYYQGLLGADACAEAPVQRCNLSAGIDADDATGTVTFHLSAPDPDFLYRLGLGYVQPLPPTVPANELINGPYPVTGPYQIASISATNVLLERNPRFQPWDEQVRPDGYVDEVSWTWGIEPSDEVAMIEAGEADYMTTQIPASDFPELRTRFTPQLHEALTSTTTLFMNTTKAPFDNLDVRRALNLAVDRTHAVELRGGPGAAVPTCQVLPANFPGYEPYCPYTTSPGLTGRWTGPDFEAGRALVTSSGTAGMTIVVGPMPPRLNPIAEAITGVLTELGYDATFATVETGQEAFAAIFDGKVSIGGVQVEGDYPAPASFLGSFRCDQHDPFTNFCAPELDALITDAVALQSTDLAAANRKWAEVDRAVTDLALWVPLVNEGSVFVSARVGDYQFGSGTGVLLDQLWVN